MITSPKYPSFNDKGIPEINDLNIIASARRQGIATLIVAFLEEQASALGHQEIGIGVALYADYGSAQRRYIKLGYIPDGLGVAYDGRPVSPGAMVRVDDDLCLYFTKPLSPLRTM